MSVFYSGDVFVCIKRIPDKSINLIYCNPPFGTTKQPWDSKLDWAKLFPELFRVLKDDGVIVIHCSIPFNYQLIREAPRPPSYSWYWNKGGSPTGYLSANHQPLRCMEEILVWKNKKAKYYRQQIGGEERESFTATPSDYCGAIAPRKKTILKGKTRTHLLEMKRDTRGFATRPYEMVELMINSYSKEGDTVLDLFCYDGLSFTACEGRRWIGIDKYHYPTLFFQNHRGPC